LAAAVRDKRHPSSIAQTLRDLFAQRLYHIASGYADGNDANSLRYDPMFQLSVERAPRDPPQDLASAPTCSRFEPQGTRTDLYRLPQACVDHFIARYPEPPAAIGLDLDQTADPTHGPQECPCSHQHSQSDCSLPLWIFAGTSHALVAAFLRPGKRPPGAENAMILVRLLASLRRHWPLTHLLGRGDSHVATPEVLEVMAPRRHMDFVCGLAGNPVLRRQAAPVMQEARGLFQQRTAVALAYGEQPPPRTRVSEDFTSAAASWEQPWRVIVKADVMAAGDNPRCVVTSWEAPTPQHVSEELYWARGHGANDIQAVKNALHSDRTSATTCLAHATRLLVAGGAYGLHHALRPHTLAHTALATAHPSTVLLTLCKVATQVTQDKDRILLPLPTSCPVKALWHRVTTWLAAIPVPALTPS
jgi:hypothetical protein